MVGVPRSKGCRICVQRRVKCDQTRPICLRCQKGNRPCPGYDADMKFQDEGPKLRKHFQEVASKKSAEDGHPEPDYNWREPSTSSSSDSSSPPTTDAESRDESALMVQLRERPSIFAMFEGPMALVATSRKKWAPLLESMERADFTEDKFIDIFGLRPAGPIRSPSMEQQQLLYTFQSSIAPVSQVNLLPVQRTHARWLSYLPPLTGQDALLDSSVRAATMAHLGRMHHSEPLMQESRTHYGKALRLLSSHLADPEKGLASETLSATVLLSFYEMFASDTDKSWVRHAGGAGTLMKLRGAARHRTGFDREIYLAYRHALIIQAFEIDTPCFLDQPEWRQLSTDIHNDLRDSGLVGEKMEIFDVAEEFFLEMVQLPGLVCEARGLGQEDYSGTNDRRLSVEDVQTMAIAHRATIKKLFMRFKTALKNFGQEPKTRISHDPVFPVVYDFVNIFVGATYTGYWTVLMLLNHILQELDPDRRGMYRAENAEAARDCCRSEAYMASSSFLGPFFVIYALRVSLSGLDDDTERIWIMERLMALGNSRLSMARDMPLRSAHPENGMPRVRQAVQEWRAHMGEKYLSSKKM